jgi:hypothetical protein
MATHSENDNMTSKARHQRTLLPCPQLNPRLKSLKHEKQSTLHPLPLHLREIFWSVIDADNVQRDFLNPHGPGQKNTQRTTFDENSVSHQKYALNARATRNVRTNNDITQHESPPHTKAMLPPAAAIESLASPPSFPDNQSCPPELTPLRQRYAGDWKLDKEAENKLRAIFLSMDTNGDSTIGEEERKLGSKKLEEFVWDHGVDLGDIFKDTDKRNMSFEDIKFTLEKERELSRKTQDLSAISILNIPRIIAACVPGGNPNKPLLALELMTPQEIQHFCRSELANELEKALTEYNERRKTSSTWGVRTAAQPSTTSNAKFALQKATFGLIGEYYKGLEHTLGFPNIDLKKAMYEEHCKRDDSKIKFQPGNYSDKETTPEECVPTSHNSAAHLECVDCVPCQPLYASSKPCPQACVLDMSICSQPEFVLVLSVLLHAHGCYRIAWIYMRSNACRTHVSVVCV